MPSKIFTKKAEVIAQLNPCLEAYIANGLEASVQLAAQNILVQKIKFPLLEFCGKQFLSILKEKDVLPFCDLIEEKKTMGGHVLLGIILQKRLPNHFLQSFQKAKEYIGKTDSWHACDIIGERVFGVGLLLNFENGFEEIVAISKDENIWIVRAMGAGIHYAIKKGLPRNQVEKLFELLLSMATAKNKEVKQGVGWAAKTTAKFHPDLIVRYKGKIENDQLTGAWFRTKIRIGLSRHQYAKRN